VVDEAAAATAIEPAGSLTAEYALAAIPARFAAERGDWRAAAALAVHAGFAAPAEALTRFARGIGAARGGGLAQARDEAARLSALHDGLLGRGQGLWASTVQAQHLAVEAWIARGEGDVERALSIAARAAAVERGTEKHPVTPGPVLPAAELYAELLLEAGRPAEALAAFQAALAREPGRRRSLAGAARAALAAGDDTAARRYSDLLRSLR